jgi:peptide/nickel transport system substrate-binding protein
MTFMRMKNGGAAALLVAVVLAACGGDEGPPEELRPPLTGKAAERPEPGGTAVLAEANDLERPMPLVWQSSFDSDLVDIMYMGLTRSAWRNGRLEYLLSEESPMAMAWHWEYAAPDSASLRYRMRSALRWSDGKPITAHDVVWTYRMFKDTRVASPRQEDVAAVDSGQGGERLHRRLLLRPPLALRCTSPRGSPSRRGTSSRRRARAGSAPTPRSTIPRSWW